MANLIRVGTKVINLDNVIHVDLDWHDDGESHVVFEFLLRGSDELDEGQNVVQPYLLVLGGREAEVVRRYLKHLIPDLLKERRTDS
jgi:hypothetical protein